MRAPAERCGDTAGPVSLTHTRTHKTHTLTPTRTVCGHTTTQLLTGHFSKHTYIHSHTHKDNPIWQIDNSYTATLWFDIINTQHKNTWHKQTKYVHTEILVQHANTRLLPRSWTQTHTHSHTQTNKHTHLTVRKVRWTDWNQCASLAWPMCFCLAEVSVSGGQTIRTQCQPGNR